jgi:HNH endonuclease
MAKLTKADVARHLHISRQTLYEWIQKGRISVGPDGFIDSSEVARVSGSVTRPDVTLERHPGHSDLRSAVWEKTAGHCWYCGVITNPWRNFCVDHLVPVQEGGNGIDNLVPCCNQCNGRKGQRSLEVFRFQLKTRGELPTGLFWFEQQDLQDVVDVREVTSPEGDTTRELIEVLKAQLEDAKARERVLLDQIDRLTSIIDRRLLEAPKPAPPPHPGATGHPVTDLTAIPLAWQNIVDYVRSVNRSVHPDEVQAALGLETTHAI